MKRKKAETAAFIGVNNFETIVSNAIKDFDIKNHDNIILLDILSNFDIEEDKKEIFNHLSLCGQLYLSSFVQILVTIDRTD